MNFIDYIEKTRKKSEGARKRVALVAALVFTAIIVGIWLTLILF